MKMRVGFIYYMCFYFYSIIVACMWTGVVPRSNISKYHEAKPRGKKMKKTIFYTLKWMARLIKKRWSMQNDRKRKTCALITNFSSTWIDDHFWFPYKLLWIDTACLDKQTEQNSIDNQQSKRVDLNRSSSI